jgi:peptide/nickel transport system substrate-binding protein
MASNPKPMGSQRRVALALGLGLLLSCGTGAEPAPADALTVVLPRAPIELDPRFTGDAYGMKLSRLLFASLVTIDPQTLEVVPDLAEQVEVLSATRYRVTLRRGLLFSDGSNLDATDVAATFRGVVAPGFATRYARSYARIARIQTPDAHTVVFELDGPHATFLTDLELPVLRAEDALRKVAQPGGPQPIGAGPYVLRERSTGQLLFEANPHWHVGAPREPRVRMLVIRDDNTRALRLLAGAGDLALNAIPPLLVPLFESDPRFEVKSAPGIGTTYLGFNLESPTLGKPELRRAIAHAIDRATLVAAKFQGRAQLASSWIVPGHWAHDPALRTPGFDRSRARALLDAAGFAPDAAGVRLRLSLRCGTDRFRLGIARAIAAMLGEVGIATEVRPSETASLIADLNRGRFDMTMMQLPELIEPHVLSWFFASEQVPGPGREGANRWRLRSAALDAALERGRSAEGREARRAAYFEAQRLLAGELPVLPLWHEDVVVVHDARARGFQVPREARFAVLAR